MNHYSRLFRYRARPDRAPLEDFLTEAFADLLTRMPHSEVGLLLDHAFDGLEHPDFSDLLARGPVEWDTQVPASGGIADLVLRIGKKPVLVFENKTWSGFQDHSTDEEEANQLTTYCAWLAQQGPDAEECAGLLLTSTTTAPKGFHAENGRYAVRCRGQLTWAALGRWLQSRLAFGGITGECTEVWQVLAAELTEFLKEKNLSSEIYNPSDVSAAHLFVPTMDRWQSTFDTIWSSAHETWTRFLGTRLSDIRISTEGGMLWQWRYATDGVAPIRSYVGLGIRFPDQSDWYQGLGLPETPHFLFLIATDTGSLRHQGPLPNNWVYNTDEAEFLTWKQLVDLDHAVDRRIDELHGWASACLGEAEQILRACDAE